MKRLYDEILKSHLHSEDEMLFLSGPLQVGKTTLSKSSANYTDRFLYLNWDNAEDRALILQGPKKIIEHAQLNQLSNQKPIIAFDELHKYTDWKNLLKGFYDTYGEKVSILVTGSARLDIYKRGGDSLMGRYFPYRMHPLSVAECLRTNEPEAEISPPQKIDESEFSALYDFGGFPKPFLKRRLQYSTRWQNLRKQQLFREDIRDVNVIHDINRLELLADILSAQSASAITYSTLAKHIRVSVDTITRWIEVLESFYFCYRVRPWSENIPRALLKEPKIFLWDWSLIKDPGAKAENFIASQLLKATHYWTDSGFGNYSLHYIRTTDKREIDFLVTKNDEPWFLVEVKKSSTTLSPHLAYFQKLTQTKHAFQVVLDLAYVDKNCFQNSDPLIVPAKTFLSQLV
jgi:uncharacterized protein